MLKAVIPHRARNCRFRQSPITALGRNDRNGKLPLLSIRLSSYISRPQIPPCPKNRGFSCSATQLTEPTTTSSSPDPPHTDTEGTTDRAGKLATAQKIIDYEFQNEDLLWEALQAPGSDVPTLNGRRLAEGNKGLSLVGDGVISLVIRLDSYMKNQYIGEANESLQRLVNNHRFATKCDKTGLAACINRNQSQRGFISPRTLADTVEAVIGAVYLDGGIDKAKSVMQTLQVIELLNMADLSNV
ncbi:ribonuclease III domain-containing protein [Xylaria cf. heliscus]|nr:ribonuclease III domain-containing protein [Xylaria cf. heliscus]